MPPTQYELLYCLSAGLLSSADQHHSWIRPLEGGWGSALPLRSGIDVGCRLKESRDCRNHNPHPPTLILTGFVLAGTCDEVGGSASLATDLTTYPCSHCGKIPSVTSQWTRVRTSQWTRVIFFFASFYTWVIVGYKSLDGAAVRMLDHRSVQSRGLGTPVLIIS